MNAQEFLELLPGRFLQINELKVRLCEISAMKEGVVEFFLRVDDGQEYVLKIISEKELKFFKIKRKTNLPYYADPLKYEREEIQVKEVKILKK